MTTDARPASAAVIAGPDCVVAVDGARALEPAVIDSLLADEPSEAFLAVLTAAGISGIPDFGYVGWEADELRVIIRGGISVRIVSVDGTVADLAAPTIRTWQESVCPRPARTEIRQGGAVLAVVPFTTVTPGLSEAEPAPAEAAQAPVVEPVSTAVTSDLHETLLPPADLGASEAAIPAPGAGVHPGPVGSEPDDVDLSHLFETRHHGVEAAAVREADDDGTPGSEPVASPALEPPAAELPGVEAVPVATSATSDSPERPSSEATQGPPALISFVPGGPRPPVTAAETPNDAAPPSPGPDADFGDLDDSTVAKVGVASAARSTRPKVQAVTCPAGHFDAPHADLCRTCGTAIVDRSIQLVERPAVGHLRFEDGRTVDIDRPLLVGRKPTVDAVGVADELPGLVTLPDPDGVLSRIHAEIRIEGWEVLVVDRGSTNGTRVEVPGQPPNVLRPGEPCVITAGTVVAFADVSSARFDVTPR